MCTPFPMELASGPEVITPSYRTLPTPGPRAPRRIIRPVPRLSYVHPAYRSRRYAPARPPPRGLPADRFSGDRYAHCTQEAQDDHEVRGSAHRPLLLAARKVESGSYPVSERGEPVYRGGAPAAREFPRHALQGDALPHQGNRRECALSAPRLLVLPARSRGFAVSDLRPSQGLDGGSRRSPP